MGDLISNNLQDDHGTSTIQDYRNPSSSSSAKDSFEFFRGGLSDYSEEQMMSHAEDIIFGGKLVPINEQLHRKQPPQHGEKHHRRNQPNHPLGCRRSRSESRPDVKKLRRNSSMSLEPAAEGSAAGSRKNSSSSRWHVLLSGLVNVPPLEMNIQDLKNRKVRLTTSSDSLDVLPVSRSVDHRRSSWKVLEFLSCKSSSVALTGPLSYMAKV